MFTGIVQGKAKVAKTEDFGDGLHLWANLPGFFRDVKKGDSIANNGVCLTIEENSDDEARFTLIRQTLEMSSFRKVQKGDYVNLEKPCKADSFLSGHYVMGHVDGVVEVQKIIPRETGIEVVMDLPKELRPYLIDKGSITLNGISLTIAGLDENQFRVALIPETLAVTNTSEWVAGTIINVEVDAVAKYVENMMKYRIQA